MEEVQKASPKIAQLGRVGSKLFWQSQSCYEDAQNWALRFYRWHLEVKDGKITACVFFKEWFEDAVNHYPLNI